MSNRFFVGILVAIALVAGFVVFSKQKDNTQNGGNSAAAKPTNHVREEGKTGVVLVEYGDFECPACGQYYPIVEQLVEKYKGQMTFQFRNYPLIQIHQNAFAAHRAAEAADNQGKFWEMYNKLYQSQQEWSRSSNPATFFEGYAKEFGLDIAKFKSDSASQDVNSRINADIKEGQNIGATSTPTFVLNGEKVEPNPRSIDDFSKLIDEAIKKKTAQ